MDQKVHLKHPQGKNSISMNKDKYHLLKPAVLKFLRANGKATFREISAAVERDFKKNGTKFNGSLPWHLEWIKLDLEARRIIKRVAGTSPQQYVAVKGIKVNIAA
jgi:hypothetical protein